MDKKRILLALGANLPGSAGDPSQMLVKAMQFLVAEGLSLLAVSRFFRSAAFPAGSGPDYVNACAVMTGPQNPDHVLAILHRIEAALGRIRTTRWASRGIDIDLLAMEGAVRPDPDTQARWRNLPLEAQMQTAPETLILPHPRLADRAFVLIPLAEIAPLWVHPLTGATVRQMCDALPEAEKAALKPFSRPFGVAPDLSFSGEPTK